MVLYGGVSLAVYIYGIVIEVQRLLRAAEELERDPQPEQLTAYARALGAAGAGGVSVDLLSGTSAGGINGILLAKALARGSDVESARDLWLAGGDIGQLLQPPSVADPKSLLQSGDFEKKLTAGMEVLDERLPGAPDPPPILDLFVSSTSLRGGERTFLDSLHGKIPTLQYRYVFQLKLRSKQGDQGYVADDFTENKRLVKLARATSAFPFAFEPVKITAADELLAKGEPDAWFADGGILNNKPFTEAVATIVTRSSDRPVRRWLFSVDPDPHAVEDAGPDAGSMPPFDRTVIRSIAAIPRYQSIVRDLLALQEHNEKVAAAERAIYEAERGFAGHEPLGPGARAAYLVMRRQAWGVEVADRLTAAARLKGSGEPVGADAHTAFRLAAEARFDAEDRADAAFELRRIYYLIKLIGMVAGGAGVPSAAKAGLWEEYERVAAALWAAFQDPAHPLELDPADLWRQTGALAGERIDEFRPALSKAVEEATARLRERLAGVEIEIQPRPVAGSPDPTPAELPPVRISLADAYDHFDQRDAILLGADLYGELRQRDRVEHAQISPNLATNTKVPAKGRLAGATLGHFGGFLDRGWRQNDLMWGRLDGAEMLMRAILREGPADQVQPLTDMVQKGIVEAELEEPVGSSAEWKRKLRERPSGGAPDGELNGRRLVSLGLRAAAIVRKMLRGAAGEVAAGTAAGRARAFLLRSFANVLGFCLALLYLPATALFAKGKLIPRLIFALIFAVFVWGGATLVLGIVGVLPFSEIIGPAAIAIAVYPGFLALYWGLGLVVRRVERLLKKFRSRRD